MSGCCTCTGRYSAWGEGCCTLPPSGDGVNGEESNQVTLVAALPGMVRLSASMAWKATEFGLSTAIRATARVTRAAANGESVGDLLQDAGAELREYLRQLLDIVDRPEDERPDSGRPQGPRANGAVSDQSEEALRERG